ncbi:Valerianol synthase TPS8 [Heracleum sosnowskyi]|uniref:Valerianol synthase TPS8 n=1 Tax=Heracleum sosnowskyi TaxID=360622 RepID=A0AAD8IC65_9APIA|nr:Valerianol synthase TPS8 [Heracleum sosnowskyi]
MGSQSRPLADHSPDIWRDKFTSIPRDIELWEAYSKERDVLKNEVRSMLVSAGGEWTDKLVLIDTVERLGVGYHFSECIEDMLADMHSAHEKLESYENYDLFTTSLYFRIFRQHGYSVASEIFNKYKEADGKLSEAITNDPAGLLSLYEAAHLRIHGEAVLDDALAFSTSRLKSMAKSLDSGSLARQVRRALEQPLHKGIQRIEAKHFISFYEESTYKNDVLLKFAKLDYNLAQMLYKQELSQVKRWWTALDFDSKFPQIRSRIVEAYFWAVGTSFEPLDALARIMFTKMLCTLSVADDLYDAYGTIEELNTYTKAIERLDIESIDGLSDQCKLCYTTLLNVLSEYEEDLVKQGSYYDVYYLKKTFQANMYAYHKEAIWCNKNYVPPLKEYLINGSASSGLCMLGVAMITGMGHVDTTRACNWATSKPKAVFATEKMGRVINDIVGYEEEHSRPHVATSIDCYMKEYGVSKEEAVVKLYELIEDTWKDMNEECLEPTAVGRQFINVYLESMRVCHVVYDKDSDGYTHPEENLKHEIDFIIMDPIPI